MPTNDLEQIALGSLQLNDATNFDIESLTFSPAQKKPLFASNANSDGESLVRESHYTPATFDLQIRIAPQETADEGRTKLGELIDAVQACERIEGGQEVPWTPNGSETTYTAYAITGDVTEVPIEASGDNAGWFINSPVAKVHLTCRPFLYAPERVVLEATESGAEPLQVVYIGDIEGDVPAEARLIVTDTAEQDRRFAMWGRDVVTEEENPALLLSANSGLTGEGFSGESKTRSGAYGSEKVLRGTAVSQPTTLCGTGRIENIGSYAVDLQVYATSEYAWFRISYRNGDGPLIPLEWKQPTVVNGWSDIFGGEITLDAAQLGNQTSEVRLEQKATDGHPANDCNYFILCPTTRGSGKARGIANNNATNLIAYDNFEQSGGSLSGKTLSLGGTWSGAGDSDDFEVIAASHTLRRTAISDASYEEGRYAIAGSTEHETCSVSVVVSTVQPPGLIASYYMGCFARYSDTDNWIMAVLRRGHSTTAVHMAVYKSVEGTVTELGDVGYIQSGSDPVTNCTVTLTVLADGSWAATAAGKTISGSDADFISGATLGEGKAGIYDVRPEAGECTREYDNFSMLGTEEGARVCYSGRQVEFNSEGCLRQDHTGTYDGRPSSYRGAGFYLEPEGELGLINRVAVRMRRNDIESEEDSAVVDKQKIEVLARERYLMPR